MTEMTGLIRQVLFVKGRCLISCITTRPPDANTYSTHLSCQHDAEDIIIYTRIVTIEATTSVPCCR